ncbi:MAG: hypothetical protein AAF404_20135 [Pseudomonadota bacterium]
MSTQQKTGLFAAAVSAIMLAGCDSAVITGTGSSAPAIGAAMEQPLLADGDFELGAAAWQSCSSNGTSELVSDASQGSLALQLNNGACRYQTQPAETGKSYTLTCDTRRNTEGWSSVTMAFLDQNLRPIDSQEVSIESAAYESITITMTAPDFTSNSEVLFYSDSTMVVDNCQLNEVSLEVPPVEMQNGNFNDGLTGWAQCSGTAASVNAGIASVADGACLHQQIDVSATVEVSAVNDPLTVIFQCDQITKSDDQYAAAIVAFLDADNAPLASAEQSITAVTTSTAVRLSAPAGTQTLELMLYSDGQTSIGQCALTTL